jgi:hypothetical protein
MQIPNCVNRSPTGRIQMSDFEVNEMGRAAIVM